MVSSCFNSEEFGVNVSVHLPPKTMASSWNQIRFIQVPLALMEGDMLLERFPVAPAISYASCIRPQGP